MANLPVGQAAEPTRMKKVRRKPTLKQKLACQAQKDKRVLLVDSLENSQRLGENHLIELGHEMVVLQAV